MSFHSLRTTDNRECILPVQIRQWHVSLAKTLVFYAFALETCRSRSRGEGIHVCFLFASCDVGFGHHVVDHDERLKHVFLTVLPIACRWSESRLVVLIDFESKR